MQIELNELAGLLIGQKTGRQIHPLSGKKVLAVSTNGFVHVGTLHDDGHYLMLSSAVNIRRWAARDGGLPEVAAKGFHPDDKVDACETPIYLHSVVFIQEFLK